MDWRSRWSSQLPSADLRIDALPFGSAWVIGTSHALSQYGAVVLYEDCVLWLEDVIKRHVDRLAVVNAFPMPDVRWHFQRQRRVIVFRLLFRNVCSQRALKIDSLGSRNRETICQCYYFPHFGSTARDFRRNLPLRTRSG